MDSARKISITTDPNPVQNYSKLIDLVMRIELKLEQFYRHDPQIFWEILPSIFACFYIIIIIILGV